MIKEENKEDEPVIQLNLHHPRANQNRYVTTQLADEFLHENREYLPAKANMKGSTNQRYMEDTSEIMEESKLTESHLTSSHHMQNSNAYSSDAKVP